jgi:hypothetical protein
MSRLARVLPIFAVALLVSCAPAGISQTGYGPFGEVVGIGFSKHSAFFSGVVLESYIPTPDQPHGYLLASIGLDKRYPLHAAFRICFRRKGQPEECGFKSSSLFFPSQAGLMFQPPRIEFLDGPQEIAVVTLPLLPGDYELFGYDYRGSQNRLIARAKESFSIPFSIAPGTTTYLGQLVMWHEFKDPPTRGLFGTITDAFVIDVANEFERDFQAAEKVGRGVKRADAIISVPNGSLPDGFRLKRN